MITESDSFTTIALGSYYAILPSDGRLRQRYLETRSDSSLVPQALLTTLEQIPTFSVWRSYGH